MPTTETSTRPITESTVCEQPGRVDTSRAEPVELEILVEEISIDGMCGVY